MKTKRKEKVKKEEKKREEAKRKRLYRDLSKFYY